MDKLLKTIPITFQKIQNYEISDIRFTKVKITLMHLGLNLNNSIFTKDVVEKALPSICNTPILGYVRVKEDGEKDFSDHHSVLIIEGKEIKIVYKGSAYGVIPESCNPRWEFITGEDGIEREYLVVDGLLWNKIEDSDIFIRDGVKKESMELFDDSITGHFDDEKHFVFDSFLFDGACALGDDTTPAMIGANIATNFTVNTDEIKTKLELFNSYFSKQSQPSNDDDINNNDTKGGEKLTTEMIDSIFAEFNLTRDDIDFEITDDMTEETLREKLEFACGDKKKKKFEAILAEFNVTFEELGEYDADITEDDFRKLVSDFAENRDKSTGDEPDVTPEPKATFSTYNQKYDLLRGALPRKEERDDDKLTYCLEYWVCDFDDNFVYVSKEEYKDDKWSYSKGRFAYSIVDDVVSITSDFEEMVVKWVTPEEETEIDKARAAFSKIEEFEANMAEFERLKQFEKDKKEEEFTSAANAIFSKFDETLKDVDGYDILKTSFSDMSLDTIEEKCYAMLGKKNANFSVQNNTPNVVNLGVDNSNDEPEDDGYGGILSRKYHE